MYQLSDDIRIAADGDEGILLDIRSGDMLRLNSTAVLIVSALRAGEEEAEIASRIAFIFTVPKESVLSDLRAFVESLEQLRLLRRDNCS
jgi:Coenzyme PQQ synthesis protein D (PqqD)